MGFRGRAVALRLRRRLGPPGEPEDGEVRPGRAGAGYAAAHPCRPAGSPGRSTGAGAGWRGTSTPPGSATGRTRRSAGFVGGPHLRESANHVRDPCPAPRPRPAHLHGAPPGQAAAPPRRPHASPSVARPRSPWATRPTGPCQLSTHYFERLVDRPEDMTDLPKAVRDDLVGDLLPTLLTPVRSLTADRGATVKQVWRLFDGALVESVLMRYPNRVTVCISSQAGCGMNCPFCATGQEGLTRNMSTAEIVEQVVYAARLLRRGELPAIGGAGPSGAGLGDEADGSEDAGASRADPGQQRRVHGDGGGAGQLQGRDRRDPPAHRAGPSGLGISARGITMSTVGLVPGIDKLAEEGIPVTLALSLHAPDDELRDELVPINTRWKVDEAHRRGAPLLRGHRAPGEHRVRPDPRHQRPGLAGRPARREARRPAAGAGCTSTRSRSTRPRARSGPRHGAGSSSSSSSGCGPTASRRRCATPAGPTSTGPAASWLRRRPERPTLSGCDDACPR